MKEFNDTEAKKFFILEKKIKILSSFLLSIVLIILVITSLRILKHLKNIDFNIYNKIESRK